MCDVCVWSGTNAKRQSIRCKFNSAIALDNDRGRWDGNYDEEQGKVSTQPRKAGNIQPMPNHIRLNVKNALD